MKKTVESLFGYAFSDLSLIEANAYIKGLNFKIWKTKVEKFAKELNGFEEVCKRVKRRGLTWYIQINNSYCTVKFDEYGRAVVSMFYDDLYKTVTVSDFNEFLGALSDCDFGDFREVSDRYCNILDYNSGYIW